MLAGESLLGHFRPDLDNQQRFSIGLVVLTNRRVLSFERQAPDGATSAPGRTAAPHTAAPQTTAPQTTAPQTTAMWRYWELDASLSLRGRDRAGLGTLELWGPAGRLAQWNYTVTQAPDVHKLMLAYDALRRGEIEELDPTEDIDPLAITTTYRKPRATALLRLVRFGRPHVKLIVIGFLLTLATTTAGLIPPYLTMPLLDDILIPYQSGKHVEFTMVKFYLMGLAGASRRWAGVYLSLLTGCIGFLMAVLPGRLSLPDRMSNTRCVLSA